jgi:hypothetical protein
MSMLIAEIMERKKGEGEVDTFTGRGPLAIAVVEEA